MAIELMTIFKVKNLDPIDAKRFAEKLEEALGNVIEDEGMAGISAYFVSAAGRRNALRVGMRFDENMNQSYLSDTASDMLELAIERLENERPGDDAKHSIKRMSSQLVSA